MLVYGALLLISVRFGSSQFAKDNLNGELKSREKELIIHRKDAKEAKKIK